jgi:hypothetical protein
MFLSLICQFHQYSYIHSHISGHAKQFEFVASTVGRGIYGVRWIKEGMATSSQSLDRSTDPVPPQSTGSQEA